MSGYGIYLVLASIGCLMLALANMDHRKMGWVKRIQFGLIWLAIFLGLYGLVEWFLMARDTTSALI